MTRRRPGPILAAVLRAPARLYDWNIAAANDHARTIEADARLHHLIADIADNRLAGALSAWIGDVLQPRLAAVIEPAVVVSVIAEQHRDLLVAIVRGDPMAAERAMREHLVYLRDVVNAVEHSPPDNLSGEADESSAMNPRRSIE